MPKIANPPRPIDLHDGPTLASINEIALTIRRSRASLCRDIAEGRIRSVKVGHSRRIIVASVREMIEGIA